MKLSPFVLSLMGASLVNAQSNSTSSWVESVTSDTINSNFDWCDYERTPLNPFIHKEEYQIGVHATRGLDAAFAETSIALGDYLTATAGQKFDPPITFTVVPYLFDGLFEAIENDEMDFLYANPGVYSCIGTQVGATALATVIKRLETRGRTFDLDVYGGVIATRADRDDINTILDIKDKVVAAGAIIDLMGGQMQIYEMERAGMSYVNDPQQMVFTKDQIDVVLGVLDGKYDVGFIRTDQIELSRDPKTGELVDPELFKILEPKIYVMDDGELFPFLHSTDVVPEWPFAALPSVPSDVQQAVQDALIDYGAHLRIGEKLAECMESQGADYCNSLDLATLVDNAPCQASDDMGSLVVEAESKSHIAGFRTARSYFELRSIQEDAGFLVQDEKDNWYCTRPSNLYEGITCPEGHYKRHEAEFWAGCERVDLDCRADSELYDCYCKPCVKSFEVDVYYLKDGEVDDHLVEFFGESLPGCEKMEICGTIHQGETITLHIYDNENRENPEILVLVHAGDKKQELQVRSHDEEPFAYEFSLTSKLVQVQVIEVFFDGKPISQSPIRVVVEEADCAAQYGEDSNRVADEQGNCVCSSNTYEMGGTCLDSAYFFLIIFAAVFIALGVMVFLYLGYKKKQSDSVWHIAVEELHFNEPPEVIGQGGFGVVILGQYRGTKVAVKRVLPPTKAKRGSRSSMEDSGESNGVHSGEIARSVGSNSGELKGNFKKKDKGGKKDSVKFGDTTNSGDIEAQFGTNSGSFENRKGSLSGSNRDWERLIMGQHSDNDILKILESATSSDHGSGSLMKGSISKSATNVLIRMLPLGLRFDEHSRRVNEFIVEMRMLSRLRHPCITTVMGAVITNTVDPMLVMEFMEYGSLHDLLHNETMTAGGEIILQVVRDIVQGIQFLHASKPPILHGDLKAKNILVDSRFRAKVADFGFSHFKSTKARNVLQGTPFFMAPEYLRRRSEYTTACDIYSLAMIIYEIYARQSPFEGEDPRKILPKVCHPRLNKRPPIPESMPPKMVELMKKCWSANAFFRPSAKDMDYVLVEMSSKDTEPLETAKESIRENLKRKPASLYDVFPKHIADALNAGKKVEAESHEIVTVVFSDIVGFANISEKFSPMKLSNMLDRLYHTFDDLANKHHIFKVETVGDAYMGVTNLDGSEFDTHVKQVAEYAIDAVRAASQIPLDEEDLSLGNVQIRVGFNSGPVVSNVIGTLNPRYGLFGDTVNTASRMESNSMPGKIHCSWASARLLETQAPDVPLQLRGMIKVKGKGKMKTYWVGGEDLVQQVAQHPMFMDPLSEREEDDPTNQSDLEEEDLAPRGGGEDKSDHSHPSQGTSDTHLGSLDEKDHFIQVHSSNKQQVKIQMDGSIKKLVDEPNHADDPAIHVA